MIRLSILGLLFIVAICCVAPAMAATAPVTVAPAAQVTLTADPFLTAATVTTSIYEVQPGGRGLRHAGRLLPLLQSDPERVEVRRQPLTRSSPTTEP
jgi:hypothetical protein